MEFLAATGAPKYENFQKCGDITTSISANKKVYALNCLFCETICLQLEVFAVHMELHAARLYDAQQPEELENYDESKYDVLNTDLYAPMDPLEEPPLKVEPEESSTIEFVVKDDKYDGCTEKIEVQSDMEANDTNKDDAQLQLNELEVGGSDDETVEKDCVTTTVPDNMDLTLAIITCYKEESVLWDISHNKATMAKIRIKRREALKNVTNAVNKRMQLNLKTEEVDKHIKKLRHEFLRKQVAEEEAIAKGEVYKAPWYYEPLSFLKSNIRFKNWNKRDNLVLRNEKPVLPLSNLTDEQNLKLIGIYKNYPSLWDLTHIDYRFKKKRQQVMEEVLAVVNKEMNLTLTQVELEKKFYLVRHACTQQKHRQLQCQLRQETFHPTCKFMKQISFLEDHVGPFKCEHCSEVFSGYEQYKVHKHQHDGSKPFVCPICNKGFTGSSNLTVHIRRHTRDFPFECKICGKGHPASTDLRVHMRIHTGQKPYCCELCGQSFRTWSFFDLHMRRHQKRTRHKCSICSKGFYEKKTLTEHMKAHLNVRDQVCNICDKAFTSGKLLRQHKQIHAEKKKYVCKICDKAFAQCAGLNGHMKSHGTTITGVMLPEEKA